MIYRLLQETRGIDLYFCHW